MTNLTPEQAIADVKAVRRDHSANHWFACACALADKIEADAHMVSEIRQDNADLRKDSQRLYSENLAFRAERDCARRDAANVAGPLLDRISKLYAELDAIKAPPVQYASRDHLVELDPCFSVPDPPAHVCAAHADMQGRCMVCADMPVLSRFLPSRPADVPAPPDGWVYVGLGHGDRDQKRSDSIALYMMNSEWATNPWRGEMIDRHYAIRWTAEPDIWHRFGLLAPSEGGGWIPHTPGDPMPCESRCEVLLKGEINDAQFRYQPGEIRFGGDWTWRKLGGENNIIGWRPALAEVAT